jgi:hypothetical protein
LLGNRKGAESSQNERSSITKSIGPTRGTVAHDPAGDMNLYRYVGNSTPNFTDPSGLAANGFITSVPTNPGPRPPVSSTMGAGPQGTISGYPPSNPFGHGPVSTVTTNDVGMDGAGGFWSEYWFYLTNPGRMDTDLRYGFYGALGTAAVCSLGAGGLAVAGAGAAGGGAGTVGAGAAVGAAIGRVAPVAGITVIGRYPQYLDLGSRIGGRVFNIPNDVWNKMSEAARWAANQKFLDRAICRGDKFLLSDDALNAPSGTIFKKEVEYLLSRGYEIIDDGFGMIPRR